MVKKKGKSSAMAVEGESYSYGMHAATTDRHTHAGGFNLFFRAHNTPCLFCTGPPQPSATKKKRVVKLTHKQLKRQKMHREKGEARADKRDKKTQRDAMRLDKKLAAKALW